MFCSLCRGSTLSVVCLAVKPVEACRAVGHSLLVLVEGHHVGHRGHFLVEVAHIDLPAEHNLESVRICARVNLRGNSSKSSAGSATAIERICSMASLSIRLWSKARVPTPSGGHPQGIVPFEASGGGAVNLYKALCRRW